MTVMFTRIRQYKDSTTYTILCAWEQYDVIKVYFWKLDVLFRNKIENCNKIIKIYAEFIIFILIWRTI